MRKLISLFTLYPTLCGTALYAADLLTETENFYNFPEGLLKAIGQVESSGNHTKFTLKDGKSSSYGFMQIKHGAAKEMGFKGNPKELLNFKTNIKYGAAYLAAMRKRAKGDLALALTCYNAGPYSFLCKNKKYSPYVGKVLNAWAK